MLLATLVLLAAPCALAAQAETATQAAPAAPVAQAAPAADAASLARQLRELRRGERHAEALALLAVQPDEVLADTRVAGERIQLLLDEDRIEEARAVDAALGPVRTGPAPLLAARLLLEILDGHAEAALQHAGAALPGLKNPSEVQAASVRALCALERWPDAAQQFAALPEDFPELLRVRLHVDILLAHGKVLAEDDDLLERAIPLLEEALKLQPSRVDSRVELVIALSQWQRTDRARQLVLDVLDAASGSQRAALLYALGRVHRADQDEVEAIGCFREVLQLCPGHGRATLALARCLVREGQDDEAVALVQQRLARAPEDPDAWFLLAERALDRHDAQPAMDALRHVLDRYPQSLKALYMSSRALALMGDAEHQADMLRKFEARTAALAMQ